MRKWWDDMERMHDEMENLFKYMYRRPSKLLKIMP